MPTPVMTTTGKILRERIMLYGDSDSGKTYNFFKVAEWHQRRHSDAHFYGITTSGNGASWDLFLMGEFADLTNISFIEVETMPDYYTAMEKIGKDVQPGKDWLCVDVIGDAWEDAQQDYARREWGMDISAKWMTEGGFKHPISADAGKEKPWNWQPIKSAYFGFAKNRVMPFPGHVMVLAWDKQLPEEMKDAEARNLFDPVGRMPVGRSDEYSRYNTIIHLGKNGSGEHVWRTVRDRQREHRLGILKEIPKPGGGVEVRNVPEKAGDFMRDYLMRVGWKL